MRWSRASARRSRRKWMRVRCNWSRGCRRAGSMACPSASATLLQTLPDERIRSQPPHPGPLPTGEREKSCHFARRCLASSPLPVRRGRQARSAWRGGGTLKARSDMHFEELKTANVAIWGFGREGRAALAALRRRFPDKPLTLYCKHDEAESARTLIGSNVRVVESAPGADALATHAIVIKSPGISAYKAELLAAQARGTVFTSGTALWFAGNSDARVIAVTGTKGKSTTTAMIAHCARALGVRTALAGNIGMPLLELDGQRADLWAIELSSFQTGEAGPLDLGVVVSLGEEHLDWHGTRERYVGDKLKLADVSRTLLVDAKSPLLMQRTATHVQRRTFDDAGGWHIADG